MAAACMFSAAAADLSAAAAWASYPKAASEITYAMLAEAQRRQEAWLRGLPFATPACCADDSSDSSSSCADPADPAELLLDCFDWPQEGEAADDLFGSDNDDADQDLAEPAAAAAFALLCRLFGEDDADLAAVLAEGPLSAEDAQLLPAAFRPVPTPACRVMTRSMTRKAAAVAHTRTHPMLTRSQARGMKASRAVC